jgi:uncharacterized membrane protein
MSTPVQIVVAAFQSEDQAQKAYDDLKTSQKEGVIHIQNAAILRKNADGKLHVKDVHDMGGGKGAAIGGVLGAALGVLAGPVGWMALGGAAVGGAMAKHADGGFSNARLEKLGEGLKPGTSAIVAVVEHTWVDEVQAAMAAAGADYTTEQISADIATQLEAGNQVAYTAVVSDAGMAAGRVTSNDTDVSVTAMVADDSGVTYMAAEGKVEPAAPPADAAVADAAVAEAASDEAQPEA